MDLLRNKNKKTLLTSATHFVFDITLATVVLLSILLFDQPAIAIILVLISKWRMLFVRPRFWWVNMLSNLPDMVFGVGIVALMCVMPDLVVQICLAVVYAIWLLFIKHGSSRRMVATQAAATQFIGLWVLFAVAHLVALPVVLVGCFIIGFSTARHILLNYDEEDSRTLLAMVWGVLVAEIGFVTFHWTLAYSFFDVLLIPQVSILVTLLAMIFLPCYDSYDRNEGKIKWVDIRWAVIFATLLILVLSTIFSGLL
ncbi:hypothetical protein FWF93_00865 [Candidatus Saccharibacteria bacterium]|nr:hypothetical protein [Candidatus Saccharibacteria bacterium]